jgi:hypothetical protein
VKTTVNKGAVTFDVPANGRSHPHVELTFELAELREAFDLLGSQPDHTARVNEKLQRAANSLDAAKVGQ